MIAPMSTFEISSSREHLRSTITFHQDTSTLCFDVPSISTPPYSTRKSSPSDCLRLVSVGRMVEGFSLDQDLCIHGTSRYADIVQPMLDWHSYKVPPETEMGTHGPPISTWLRLTMIVPSPLFILSSFHPHTFINHDNIRHSDLEVYHVGTCEHHLGQSL